MAPLTQIIANRFLGQQVNLLRLSSSERDKVFVMLGALQARVLAKMDTQIPLPGFGTFTQQKLGALYRLTDKLMDQAYNAISTLHDTTLLDVSQFQSQQARKVVNAVIGVPLMTVGLPLVNLKALVNDDLVDGRPAAYWWNQQATTLKTRYRDEVRQGVFAGDTLGQLKQRVRGTKAQNFQDGIMAVTSRNADALIRTSILSVANAARYETLKANDDVLDGQQWLSTLDPRTCEICAALDGQAWDFDGNIMEDTTQEFPGPPPQHFNCRCTLVPVLKSWKQMQEDAGEDSALGEKLDDIEDGLDPGTRASMDGQVSAKMTYEEWLNEQDEDMQQDILGPKRFALWQKNLIDVYDLVDQKNRALTLDQIKARAEIDDALVSKLTTDIERELGPIDVDNPETWPYYDISSKSIHDLYHVTMAENLQGIYEQGFRARVSSSMGDPVDTDRIFFATNRAQADSIVSQFEQTDASVQVATIHLKAPAQMLDKLDPRIDMGMPESSIAVNTSKKLTDDFFVDVRVSNDAEKLVPKKWRERIL